MPAGREAPDLPARRVELDALRGLAVAGMILVVSPGDWGATFAPLQHAAWDGWTLADMVFPTFLFSVGAALGLSFPRDWTAPARRTFWRRVARRSVLLILLGLILEATFNWALTWTGGPIGRPGLAHLRLPGVLQRIALCYLLAAGVIVATGTRGATTLRLRPGAVAIAAAGLLILYWALMLLVPVPGHGAGRLDPAGNLAAYVDRAVFTPAHLWPMGWANWGGPIVYDPEGLLSTVPATANVLAGAVAAWSWQARPARVAALLLAVGGVLLLGGVVLGAAIPINKRIWTPSFALLSSGFSAALLAGVMLAWRLPGVRRMATPLLVLGGNAVLAFTLSTLLGRLYDLPIMSGAVTPRAWLNDAMRGIVATPQWTSLACAVLFVAVVTLALWPLHRRAFHFRL